MSSSALERLSGGCRQCLCTARCAATLPRAKADVRCGDTERPALVGSCRDSGPSAPGDQKLDAESLEWVEISELRLGDRLSYSFDVATNDDVVSC
jgi:hypothetical protein